MASVKGANITNIDATPIVKVSSENAGGKIRVYHDTYEAASLASGSDITIARIPKHATIAPLENDINNKKEISNKGIK